MFRRCLSSHREPPGKRITTCLLIVGLLPGMRTRLAGCAKDSRDNSHLQRVGSGIGSLVDQGEHWHIALHMTVPVSGLLKVALFDAVAMSSSVIHVAAQEARSRGFAPVAACS